MPNRQHISFKDVVKKILDFEQLLLTHNIQIANSAPIESQALSALDILHKFTNRDLIDRNSGFRKEFAEASAIYDLALKILSVKNHPDFKKLVPHLKLLNTCYSALNCFSPVIDSNANKIIELYIASLCMRFCVTIELDDPDKSTGRNPDVIATIDNRRWGFACKTIHTDNIKTLRENIEKAVDQIENSDCEVGIPVINLKNLIPHNQISEEWENESEPLNILGNVIKKLSDSLAREWNKCERADFFRNKKSIAGVAYVAHSTAFVFQESGANRILVPTRLNKMSTVGLSENAFKPGDAEVLQQLNHFMQQAD